MKDVIIVGAGPAGLTAALYAVRAGVSVTVLEKGLYGGQSVDAPEIDNIPGFIKIRGAEFAMKLYEQVHAFGVEVKREEVQSLSLQGPVKQIQTTEGEYEAKTVILANGLKRRMLGCPGEKELAGKGVSYCATCDGAFYKGKKVVLVGGGNAALEDALFLSNHCSKVTLVHRRREYRAEKAHVEPLLKKKNVTILYNTTIKEIKGEDRVKSVVVTNNETEKEDEHKIDGVFIAIGYEPDNHFLAGQLPLTDSGYLEADENCTTAVEGVFVAGDCREKFLRQIVTATCDGAVAGVGAAAYVTKG